ncbi:MAG: outer membrane lipoprotein-sorting protein [Planctomycetes bacterium]|nr:outer membrane lipoprotein-sorting protein [Planctomycetota bacterium]
MVSVGTAETPPTSTQPATSTAVAEKLTVDQIVDRTNHVSYYQGRDGKANVSMKIVDSQSRERSREFSILRRDVPKDEQAEASEDANVAQAADQANTGEQKLYVFFRRPPDVNKMVFMVHKHLDRADDRWLYLPALDLVKRISAADKRTSFVGSHFLYEDVSGRNVNDDKHELVEVTDTYYVLKNTPKDPKLVEFAYYKMWIHRQTFLVVQTSYYDENDKEYRRYKALNVQNIQGYRTVTKSEMRDLTDNSHTVMEYADVKYNLGLSDDFFTERYLKRPPMEKLQ